MNTETRIHEYTQGYNTGKANAIKELVSTITDRLNKHNDLIGVNGIAHEKAVIQMLHEYKKEVLGNEG